jgi:hypothetical protein
MAWVIFLASVVFGSAHLSARNDDSAEKRLQTDLVRYGFENVAVCRDSAELIVTYENRITRFEVRAIREALRIVARRIESPTRCILIPQNRGIPLMAVIVDSSALRSREHGEQDGFLPVSGFDATLDIEPYWGKIRNRTRENSSSMKLDVFIHPQFKAQFGNVIDAVQSQVNLAPAVSTVPWKGLSLAAQWIFPLQNELGYEGDHDRPGFLTLNQTVRLASRTFVSGTIGYFSEHRYGGDLEIRKYWKNGRWAADFNVGMTGFAAWAENGWIYSDLADWTCFLSGEYRFPELDLTLKAGVGKFLYQDNGWRFDACRQFGEVGIGFYAVTTDEGRNGGFSLTIPVFPSKRMSPRRIRVSPALYFPWSYRYRGMPVYGIQYETQNRLDGFLENLNPDFVKSQLSGTGSWN